MSPHDTAGSAHPMPRRAGLLEKLMAAVRPEFRVEVWLPTRPTRCWGNGAARCPAATGRRGRRACAAGTATAGASCGRPELAVFLADPGPPLHGRSELVAAPCAGCRYGSSGYGLCMRHRDRLDPRRPAGPGGLGGRCARQWTRRRGTPSAGCRSARCGPRTTATCSARPTRPGGGSWAAPTIEDYITHCLLRGRARIDFRGLAPAAATGAAVRRSVPPRRPDDHRAAAGGGLGDPPGHRRRGGLAARP